MGKGALNITLAAQIIEKTRAFGVFDFCLCPGGRNAPFVEVLSRIKDIQLYTFFEERSAAFFAVGMAKKKGRPAAVVTTSGTAVLELYPALIEAYYSGTPLVLITADRPLDYKGTGAPQSIEQINIFSQYAEKTLDLTAAGKIKKIPSLFQIQKKGRPIHINARFDEPLLDEKLDNLPLMKISQKKFRAVKNKFNLKERLQIKLFFKKLKKPLVILSGLPLELREGVTKKLLQMKCPIYAEPLSNLRESQKLSPLILKSGEENILSGAVKKGLVDGIIRIGAVPTLRFWRDLNNRELPVLSFSLNAFSGLKKERSKEALSLPAFLSETWELGSFSSDLKIFEEDQKKALGLEESLKEKLISEISWIRRVSQNLHPRSHIFLGNSLPIRLWDRGALRKDQDLVYTGNRGANGIDGILSAFFGSCFKDRPNVCILGDLSALYDLSAPWVLDQMKNFKIQIILINNFGGQIFSHFKNEVYLNRHQQSFKNWAEMWHLNYSCLKEPAEAWPELHSPSLIEIQIL